MTDYSVKRKCSYQNKLTSVPEFYPLLPDNLLQLLRPEVETTEQLLCLLVPMYHVLCFLLLTDMWVYFNRPVLSAKCCILFLVASRQLAALAEDTCNRIRTLHTLRLWSHKLLQNATQITVLEAPGSIPKVCNAVYTHFKHSLYHRRTNFFFHCVEYKLKYNIKYI